MILGVEIPSVFPTTPIIAAGSKPLLFSSSNGEVSAGEEIGNLRIVTGAICGVADGSDMNI
jgi:hypothetical protein